MEPTSRLVDAGESTSPKAHSRGRRLAGSVVAGLLTVAVLAGCLSEDQSTVQTQINNSRAANGRAALADYATADTKAQAWAEHLADIGRLEHSDLRSGYQSGTWCNLGENVGMGPNLAAIHNAFMNSPSHKANILNSVFDSMGTGVVKRGSYYYVVHEFVNRC